MKQLVDVAVKAVAPPVPGPKDSTPMKSTPRPDGGKPGSSGLGDEGAGFSAPVGAVWLIAGNRDGLALGAEPAKAPGHPLRDRGLVPQTLVHRSFASSSGLRSWTRGRTG